MERCQAAGSGSAVGAQVGSQAICDTDRTRRGSSLIAHRCLPSPWHRLASQFNTGSRGVQLKRRSEAQWGDSSFGVRVTSLTSYSDPINLVSNYIVRARAGIHDASAPSLETRHDARVA